MLAAQSVKQWLKIGEAARLLGVTEATLRNWDRAGHLRARRHPVNGYRLYSTTQIRELVEAGVVKSPGADNVGDDLADNVGDDLYLPPGHWDPLVALDPKHRPQIWDLPASTVRRDWRKYPQEAYVIRRDGHAYRRLTPGEIAALQSLPPECVEHDALTNRQRIAAVGDAVPPPLAAAVGAGLLDVLPDIGRATVEICAGVGGMARGMHAAGFEHLAAIDRDEPAVTLLRSSGVLPPELVHLADVRAFDFSAFEGGGLGLLCGGPPCQPWSQSGHRRGIKDERDLMGWIPDLVALLSPGAFVFENVPGLLVAGNRPYLEHLVERLRRPGNGLRYGVAVARFNAADFGVPQTRRRVFFLGLRDRPAGMAHRVFDAVAARRTHRGPGDFSGPVLAWRTVGDAIGDLPDPGGWRRWPI